MDKNDDRITANLSRNITDAMFEFQKKTRDESDYTAVALGLHYLLISIYKGSKTPNWKAIIKRHLYEMLDEVDE